MPKKALVVRFRNAAVFTNRRGSSDKVFAGRALVDRDKAPRMDVPEDTLDTRHISNMLHVLMGERPVPSLRKTAMTRDEAIYRAARQALVRVSELSRDETKTVRKAVKDAWHPATLWYQLNGGAVKV